MRLNGAAVRAIRERMGLSVTAAATAAGVTQPTWSNWERGTRRATPANVLVICEVLRLEDRSAILAVPEQAAR